MNIQEFFANNSSVAIGVSGGADSAYLLYAGLKFGTNVKGYYVKTPFQPEFEMDDVYKLSEFLGTKITIIEYDVLNCNKITENSGLRCYYCKRAIFECIKHEALKDGYDLVADGTNASDDLNDRPGIKALRELGVVSPLRECGITKAEIRKLSEDAGLFTSNKAAYSCLATRICCGEKIDGEKLKKIEHGEKILFNMGFSDFRIRLSGNVAKIQVIDKDMNKIIKLRKEIVLKLKEYFGEILLDLEERRVSE